MAKEGENYLDDLLNTVAPDWEETSSSPDVMSMSEDEMSIDDVSLEDALSILNDLPDDLGETSEEEGKGDMMGAFPDFTADFGEEAEQGMTETEAMPSMGPEETPTMEEPMSMPQMEEPMMIPEMEEPETLTEEMPDIPEVVEEPAAPEAVEESAAPEAVEEPAAPEAIEEPDIPMEIGEFMSQDEPAAEEAPVSKVKNHIDVDDIFKDALSAVEYSGSEDESGDAGDEDLFSLEDVAEYMDASEEGISSVPVADPMTESVQSKGKKKKGPGFFARIFGNIVTDQTADEEEKERQAELEAQAKKAAEKEEKKQQAAVTKEEKAQLSQEEKERKKEIKAEKAAKKAEEKEEKKRRKAEAAAEAEKEVVGKINPIGATIVIIFFVTIGAFTVFGSRLLSRNLSLNSAENYFANEEYLQAYDAISSVNLKEDDEVLFRRIRICSQMQKEVNSYTNYTSMNMRLEALDALIKGIRYYDINKAEADSLGITGEYNRLMSQMLAGLSEGFGMSEAQARKLLAVEDQGEYTRRLEEVVAQTQPAV